MKDGTEWRKYKANMKHEEDEADMTMMHSKKQKTVKLFMERTWQSVINSSKHFFS